MDLKIAKEQWQEPFLPYSKGDKSWGLGLYIWGGNMYYLWKIWMIFFIVDESLWNARGWRENHFLKNVLMLRVVDN
jgi:hypothetical protein